MEDQDNSKNEAMPPQELVREPQSDAPTQRQGMMHSPDVVRDIQRYIENLDAKPEHPTEA